MITKRSNHMPTLTRIEITNSTGRLRRARANHSTCGARTLQVSIVQ